MSKLHELLAVRGNLAGQAEKCRSELIGLFEKPHLFEEKRITFIPNEPDSTPETIEQKDIQTSIAAEIKASCNVLAKQIDIGYQTDIGNTEAKADVVTEDGETLLRALPTTALMQLEHRLQDVQALLKRVPTLDPAKGFQPDPHRGIYRAREVIKDRTKKKNVPLVMAPATKEHPAQVQLVTEDIKLGTLQEMEWSSLVTPAQKNAALDRCDILLRAVRKAIAKANEQEVDVHGLKIGKKVLDYVFEPITSSGQPARVDSEIQGENQQ